MRSNGPARKNKLIHELTKRGYETDDLASTTSYVAMAKPGLTTKFFVGKQGDLRFGLTYKTSKPADKTCGWLLGTGT